MISSVAMLNHTKKSKQELSWQIRIKVSGDHCVEDSCWATCILLQIDPVAVATVRRILPIY